MASTEFIPPKDLAGRIADSSVQLLVGSGTSCACGLPSWAGLIKDMKAALRLHCPKPKKAELADFLKRSSALEIAGTYKRRVGNVVFTRFLREKFRDRASKIAPILKTVTGLPISTFFTTNYDKLLETACRTTRDCEDPPVIIEPSQLQGLNGHERRIIKLHGDIDHPNSIILTDEDYATFNDLCAAMRNYFQGQMAFNTLLLVGFGLKDPNFERIHAGVRHLIGGSSPEVIAVMAGQNEYDLDKWRQQGLAVVSFDTHDEVHSYLKSVKRCCK